MGDIGSIGDEDPAPPALSFPGESIGEAEKPWAELLRTGSLPLRSPAEGPGAFVVHQSWETLLVQSLGRRGDWLTPYHLGVIAFERGETQKALSCWEQSLGEAENAWALRNLGFASLREGKPEAALDYYRRAFDRDEGRGDQSLAEEYIPLLVRLGRLDEAERDLAAYRAGGEAGPKAVGVGAAGPGAADPGTDVLSASGPLLDAAARIAVERGDDAALDRFVAAEPAHIREGNTALADLWIAREARRLAAGNRELPREIDFRMYTRKG
jgi:tetratricopeptide (TPR) repeat protein